MRASVAVKVVVNSAIDPLGGLHFLADNLDREFGRRVFARIVVVHRKEALAGRFDSADFLPFVHVAAGTDVLVRLADC
jgi:hypothetical protein